MRVDARAQRSESSPAQPAFASRHRYPRSAEQRSRACAGTPLEPRRVQPPPGVASRRVRLPAGVPGRRNRRCKVRWDAGGETCSPSVVVNAASARSAVPRPLKLRAATVPGSGVRSAWEHAPGGGRSQMGCSVPSQLAVGATDDRSLRDHPHPCPLPLAWERESASHGFQAAAALPSRLVRNGS